MKIEILTQGWVASRPVRKGEEPEVMLHGVVRVGDTLIGDVESIRVRFRGREFARVELTLIPGEIEVKALTEEEWADLEL